MSDLIRTTVRRAAYFALRLSNGLLRPGLIMCALLLQSGCTANVYFHPPEGMYLSASENSTERPVISAAETGQGLSRARMMPPK